MLELKMNAVKTILEIIGLFATIIGIPWAITKYLYRYKQKVLYFTNCHLIHKSLWDLISSTYRGLKNSNISHTFTPLILIPHSYKKFANWQNGNDVIVKFITGDGNSSFVQAKMFWLPEQEPWCHFKNPCISLVLRRYFGIERPTLGIDDKETVGWHAVLHPKKDLDPLHRVIDDEDNMKWQCNNAYSNRFWLPLDEEDQYHDFYVDGSFLEYCGLKY